jgi:hypothetical protein
MSHRGLRATRTMHTHSINMFVWAEVTGWSARFGDGLDGALEGTVSVLLKRFVWAEVTGWGARSERDVLDQCTAQKASMRKLPATNCTCAACCWCAVV